MGLSAGRDPAILDSESTVLRDDTTFIIVG